MFVLLTSIRCFDFHKIYTMSRIIKVSIQNSLHQSKNREEVKNREIRYLPDLSIFNMSRNTLYMHCNESRVEAIDLLALFP